MSIVTERDHSYGFLTSDIQIVEPFSAILGLPNERAIPINADHREIVQVSPRDEHRYLPVWSSISELMEGKILNLSHACCL
jgi:hypothetical protein